jgi:predicted GIY-YIG superfamily endonuclease
LCGAHTNIEPHPGPASQRDTARTNWPGSKSTTIDNAIKREKELKKWRCDWKIRLIEEENAGWVDLSPGITS